MVYEQPSIELFGILINEPITTVTDLLVSGVCFYAFIKLRKYNSNHKVLWFFQYYFLSMSIATFIGGVIGHAFFYLFNFYWKLPGWLTSMISVALVERASIEYARKFITKSVGVFFTWLNIIELTVFIIMTFTTLNFLFVEIHSAYGLLIVVAGFNGWVYYKSKSKASKIMLIAVGISAISALVYMNEWGIGPWFNHYDISHCFMALSAWAFYKGAKEVSEHLDDLD